VKDSKFAIQEMLVTVQFRNSYRFMCFPNH